MSRVLVIDDDRLQFRLLQELFKNFRGQRFELDWSETYAEGLGKLLSEAYDVCLLDYRLGEHDGLALLREAYAAGCRVPIVFLTAEQSGNVDIEALEAGALDYLVKAEITPRSLERSIRYALKLGETLEALRRLATHDELTGLANRREYDRIIAEEEVRARRFGDPLSFVMLDIDHFKAVNDTHGHAAGDAVLRGVAQRLALVVRAVDRAARLGGEEFGLILPHTSRAEAFEVASRAIRAVAQAPIAAGANLELSVTVSAGVAELPADASTAEGLYASADRALYAAKERGRNRVVAAGEGP